MTILVDWEIKELISSGELIITPYDESLINPASLDIKLGNTYGETEFNISSEKIDVNLLREDGNHIIDPTNKDSFKTRNFISNTYILEPLSFITINMFEYIKLPVNVCAKLVGKSSLGRMGLMQSSVAGFLDPGFAGVTTMELFNYNSVPIKLSKDMLIGQLIFDKVEVPEKDYSKTGRYYEQTAGTGSKGI